jgi:hypothetical protein
LLALITRFDVLEREVVRVMFGHETIAVETAAGDTAKPLLAE